MSDDKSVVELLTDIKNFLYVVVFFLGWIAGGIVASVLISAI